jgi:hypothetical protein
VILEVLDTALKISLNTNGNTGGKIFGKLDDKLVEDTAWGWETDIRVYPGLI